MYKKFQTRFFRLTLKSTPSEHLRDEIIKSGVSAAEKSGYLAGNTTELLLKLITKADTLISKADTVGEVVGSKVETISEVLAGGESIGAVGRIAYKTTRDIAKGDTLCTGLCFISGTAETVAFICSTVKIIPFRGKIYVGAKFISRGCMSFRNLCAGEGC